MNIEQESKNLLKASFIGTFSESLISCIASLYILKIGGDMLDVGIAFAVFNICKGLFTIFFGKTELFKKNLHFWQFFGFLMIAFTEYAFILCTNKYYYFINQVFSGVIMAVLNPAWEALYSADESAEDLGEKWSLWGGGADFAVGIGAIVGGLITTFIGWNTLFIITGTISLYSSYYSYLVYKNRNV